MHRERMHHMKAFACPGDLRTARQVCHCCAIARRASANTLPSNGGNS
jgi:hypothetical protein